MRETYIHKILQNTMLLHYNYETILELTGTFNKYRNIRWLLIL